MSEKTAWLIERGQAVGHSPTIWWCGGDERANVGEDEMKNWTEDANQARKFPSQVDALILAKSLFGNGLFTVTQHVFL